MPNKKAERRAAKKGINLEAHRAEAKARKENRRKANEEKVAKIMNDPTVNSQLHEAIRGSESFGDLWNNPMVRAAREQMTPEQVEQYERLGREMYGTLDFENISESKAQDDMDAEKYIVSALNSGLRPCDLEEHERDFMATRHGEAWFERFGGYGQPLADATNNDVNTARRNNEDAFLRAFGVERVDLQKELGGNL